MALKHLGWVGVEGGGGHDEEWGGGGRGLVQGFS